MILSRVGKLSRILRHSSFKNIGQWDDSNLISVLRNPELSSPTLFLNERFSEYATDEAGETLEVWNRKETRAEKSADGIPVIRAGFGESPFPIPQFCFEEMIEHAGNGSYQPVLGVEELREVCAEFLNTTRSVNNFTPENIVVGPGSKSVMANIIRCLDAEVIVCTPAWVSYRPQAFISGKEVNVISCTMENAFFPTPQEIEEVCSLEPNKRRLLILNSPNNPTGAMTTAEQLIELVPVLDKCNIMVLSDEIYSQFHDKTQTKHESLSKFYREKTIVVEGLSKTAGAGGWRLGFAGFPESLSWMIPAMRTLASHTYSCVCGPIQYAAIAALTPSLRDYVDERLRGAGLELCDRVDGGFYCYPVFDQYRDKLQSKFGEEYVNDEYVSDVGGIVTASRLCRTILQEKGVAVLEGGAFLRPVTELGFRYCMVDFDGGTALEAVAEIVEDNHSYVVDEKFLKKYCANVVEATDRIVDFVEEL